MRKLFGSVILKQALTGTVFKVLAGFSGVVMTMMLTRTLGASESGVFFLAHTIITILSIVFRFGLDNVVLKWFGREGITQVSQGKLSQGLLFSIVLSVPVLVVLFIGAPWLSDIAFNQPDMSSVLRLLVIGLPAMLVYLILAPVFQGLGRFGSAVLFQNLGVTAFFVLLYGGGILSSVEPSAMLAAACFMFAAFLVGSLALVLWFFVLEGRFFFHWRLDEELWSSSFNMWIVSLMSLAVLWSGVLVSGFYLEKADVAYLTAAQRVAALASFLMMVANLVVAPRYAKLWASGERIKMERLAKSSTRFTVIAVLPLIGLVTFYSVEVMEVFGEGFGKAGMLLVIMVVGQFVNLATGSVNYLLSMSGHEKDYRTVTVIVGLFSIGAAVCLTKEYGVYGAATSTALALALQNLGALGMVKRRLGFWPV